MSEFAKGGRIENAGGPSDDRVPGLIDNGFVISKKKHRIVMERNGEWVMNKKTIQDRINEKFNGR